MHQKFPFSIFLATMTVLFLSACSNTKFLKDDQLLYTGLTKINFADKEHLKKVRSAETVIDAITFSKPNNALFGPRRVLPPIGLWTYNYLKPKKEGKKGGWMYRNMKKDPILISTVNPDLKCRQLETALFGLGFFHAKATHTIEIKKNNPRKAKIQYSIYVDEPFRINKIVKANPVDSVDIFLNTYIENLKIEPGDIFNLEIIQIEKQKMATQLIDMGYYFFGPNYLEFIADTSVTPFQIDLMIRKSKETPEYVVKKYSIDQIKVDFFDLTTDTISFSQRLNDSIFYDGISIIGSNNYLKPEAIRHCIQFDKGDLYSTARHQGTIKQLNNYAVFRNVKVQFVLSDTLNRKLNMLIEVSPKENVSVNLEGYVQAKSTGFAGPGIEASLAHGNIGRAANTLQLKLTGGFEWQLAKSSSEVLGANSYNAGVNTAFVFPKFVTPFKIKGENSLLSSKTICDLGFEFLNNVRYYRMTSFTAGLSYQWKKRQKITNIFSPVKVNMVNLLETTTEFDSIVESNIYVKKSFEEQTILGMQYTFIYDNTVKKSNGIYLQAIVGTSGNAVSLLNVSANENKPYKILGNVYSQFVKGSVDIRYYTKTSKKGLVFRLYSGMGYSYGNSTVMPYIEQFYSGGSTSIRAFTARSLGPGSYKPEGTNGIIDQTGDIKLEFNTEYRVPFSDMVHGAIFADVGNVWLLNKDEYRPGAEFKLNTFSEQLAFGSGFGLRFDFDFFVLRTDLGFPLRNTFKTDDSYWINNFSESMKEFRFNLAIGYPF
ncbi:MAG TPA: BamA/TamA family outer membrane protein [Bacteroidia bacterium]|nr:BamA/TamA family outer membrane protein [Bacteroidia bacterium]